MVGDAYPSSGRFECRECTEAMISDEHYNACPSCGELMESVSTYN